METRKEWTDAILRIVLSYPQGTRFTADRVRIDAVAKKLPQPPRSGMWGSTMRVASKDGLIRKTGTYLPSTIKFMNKRAQAEWERL